MENEIVETQEKETVKKTVKPKKIKDEKKNKSHSTNWLACFIAGLIGAASMYLFVYYVMPMGSTSTVINKSEKEVTVNENGIADAVEKLYDAVVVVTVYKNETLSASGTGFVYKTEGKKAYILTNNHVINNATDVYVTFTDGTIVKTNVEGSDVYSDIAVLSVESSYIKSVAKLGNSEDLRLGDTVFAIGAPLDSAYSWSVSRGIVSGKDRLVEVELSSGNTKTPMVVNTLQTDAAINSGNSGGPLANSNGEVIGITSIKLASAQIEGMGFAIPIEIALDYAEELIKGEEIERPFLGISMLDVNQAYYTREYYSLIREANVTKGVIVSEVQKKSSAALAGIEENDIITKVDGKEIASSAYLRYYLYKHKVGDEMKVTIIRNNKEKDIKIKLSAN